MDVLNVKFISQKLMKLIQKTFKEDMERLIYSTKCMFKFTENSINIIKGPLEDRVLMTGLHTVCDIYCMYCQSVVGWKYV
jgi:hypothetical protein